jgi:endonuclease/exonuclease/phosphatase family metal-dependent hydrolase
MKFLRYILFFICAGIVFFLINMTEEASNITIGFYNLENLFDTIDDPHINDNEYLPDSKKKWNTSRYNQKIQNLSKVISQLGDNDGPEILGLCEVENGKVLQDLLKTELLKGNGYEIVHMNSQDKRGIDAAMIYKKKYFQVLSKCLISSDKEDGTLTPREILLVKGLLGKDTLFILVNHWPSRLGGESTSEEKRIHLAKVLRKTADSILNVSKTDNILLMGDFNDEPVNKSISKFLNANNNLSNYSKNDLLNPFYEVMQEGEGTIKYKSDWELFDQIMISASLKDNKAHTYLENSAGIYSPLWMHYMQKENNGPHRSFINSKYYGGYSDHFPVFIQLKK